VKYLLLLVWSAFALASQFETDIDKAFQLAQKSNRPLLISFFGVWCPPCNELEEIVFESTKFIEKSKNFTLLKVDADKKESWTLKNKYKVGGYPTLVFTDPKGKEIYRVVGFRSIDEFMKIMDLVLRSKGVDFKSACSKKGLDDLLRCATVCSEREDKECAKIAFKKILTIAGKNTVPYLIAETFFAETNSQPELKKNAFENLLKNNPVTPQSLVWALSYLELGNPNLDLLKKVISQFEDIQKNPLAESLGITATDEIQMQAQLLEAVGKIEESKSAWALASQKLEEKAVNLGDKSVARGFTIERIGALEMAGKKEEALKLAQEYRKKFPLEFTFHYQTASLLESLKRYPEALKTAEESYLHSYGDNRIRAATLWIRLLATVPDKAQAQKVFDEVSRELDPDASLQIRTHRYLKKLQEAWRAFP